MSWESGNPAGGRGRESAPICGLALDEIPEISDFDGKIPTLGLPKGRA
jgi:hypothetical protein